MEVLSLALALSIHYKQHKGPSALAFLSLSLALSIHNKQQQQQAFSLSSHRHSYIGLDFSSRFIDS